MFTILYVFLKAYGTLDHKTLMFRLNNNKKVLVAILFILDWLWITTTTTTTTNLVLNFLGRLWILNEKKYYNNKKLTVYIVKRKNK